MQNRVIQREKVLSNARNVLYNPTNAIFDKKSRPIKSVIRKIKILKYLVFFGIFGTLMSLVTFL